MKFSRNGTDLLIDLGNGSDVLIITDGLGTHGVEQYLFADGTTITIDDIKSRLTAGTAGDDNLIGFDNRNDVLDGGTGSDAMAGGAGNDTYKFGFGDGSDLIFDSAGIDRVVFKTGVTQGEVKFSAIGDDLLITLTRTGENLVVLGGLGATPVENFVFDGGDTLTLGQIKAQISAQTDHSGQEVIDLGTLPAGVPVEATPGNDKFYMTENSTVVFRVGRRHRSDRLVAVVFRYTQHYTIQFADLASTAASVRLADINGQDIVVSFASSGDEVVLVGGANGYITPTLKFGDGAVWDAAKLAQIAIDRTDFRVARLSSWGPGGMI